MNKISLKHHRSKISRLMLVLTLFLGIFTFSGFSGNSTSIIVQKATKTEVGIRSACKAGKTSVSYRGALGLLRVDQALYFYQSWKIALLSFNNLVQVRLIRVSLPPPSQSTILSCLLTRTISQRSDEEEPFIS